jgi:hypothetical protein
MGNLPAQIQLEALSNMIHHNFRDRVQSRGNNEAVERISTEYPNTTDGLAYAPFLGPKSALPDSACMARSNSWAVITPANRGYPHPFAGQAVITTLELHFNVVALVVPTHMTPVELGTKIVSFWAFGLIH